MLQKIKNILKGRNKYFILFFLALSAVVVVGIISPVLLENKRKNWELELKRNIRNIELSVVNLLNEKQKNILGASRLLKEEIKLLLHKKSNLNKIFNIINSEKYKDYSVELLNEKEDLIVWTSTVAIPKEDFFPLSFEVGEVFFYQSDLISFLSVIDTCFSGENLFYYAVSLPIEKHYEIQNNYYEKINLTEYLSKRFLTEVEIDYSQFAQISRDGRKFSIEIKNNKDHKIAVINFNKPALDSRINSFNEDIADFQTILALIAVLFLLLGFWQDYRKLKNNLVKSILLVVAIVPFRYLLYKLNFPAKFIESPLNNSSFFASVFGDGIVKSPLELFITVFLFMIVCLSFYNLCWKFFDRHRNNKNRSIYSFFLVLLVSVSLFLLFLRGLGASLKSVIFDSSLRYFKEVGLLPNLPAGLMQLNVLILGFSSFLISVSIILIIIHFLPVRKNEVNKLRTAWIVIFVFFQATGYFFDYLQTDPQGNGLIRFLFITFSFIIAYKIFFEEKRNIYNYVYAALAASIITVSLLNFYNSKLEKESLKTTAFELTRTNDSWLEFLITQTLIHSSNKDETYRALKDQLINYQAQSFLIWSQSLLQKEKLNSSVALLNKRKELLGSFGIDLDEKYRVNPLVLKYEGDELQIYNNYRPAQLNGKIISGILPIKEDGVLLGYIVASIFYDETGYGRIDYPKVLSQDFNTLNSTVDFEKLKIFDFKKGELFNVYGELIPPDEITKEIINAKFKNSEAWINMYLDKDEYITYILKFFREKNERILAVALKVNDLSWSLYNFLKVFFIHMIFIIGFLTIIFTLQLYKARNIRYTFRLQLLAAFLFLSLFPLILLAFYNRNLSEEKNNEATLINLKEKALNINHFLEANFTNPQTTNFHNICEKASEELNINYTLYANQKVKYCSKNEFYEAGFISEYLNPDIYVKFNFFGFKEDLENENIEKYNYSSFYKKIKLYEANYILKVDDIFNKVSLPITGEEYDVFLFGSYSVVIILVVLFSAFLANRISSPIRKLTKATTSVAEGDLSLEVNSSHKGEVGALVNGFNFMIRQLKKSQYELAEMERENAWKEMARQVAHEIKNPLTPMKLAVQQLIIAYKDKSTKFDSIFDKVSKTIIGQIETLSNIASEFSSFARMPKLKMEKFNTLQVAEEAINLFLEEKVEIKISRKDSEFLIDADKDQLKRTIINLLRNSIQAGADKIDFEIFKDEMNVGIKIKDNGKGIPEEILSKVFEPNFTTKEKGMGLGLKLAKKYLENINGSISIQESGLSGTIILIQIPIVKE